MSVRAWLPLSVRVDVAVGCVCTRRGWVTCKRAARHQSPISRGWVNAYVCARARERWVRLSMPVNMHIGLWCVRVSPHVCACVSVSWCGCSSVTWLGGRRVSRQQSPVPGPPGWPVDAPRAVDPRGAQDRLAERQRVPEAAHVDGPLKGVGGGLRHAMEWTNKMKKKKMKKKKMSGCLKKTSWKRGKGEDEKYRKRQKKKAAE